MSKIKRVFNYISHVREKSKQINKSGLYICFALISLYALIMSAVCFINLDAVMGFVNLTIAVVMILIILVFSRIKSAAILSISVDIFLYALMVFFLYEGGVGGVSIMWLLFVPMGGMALINLFYGAILSLLLGFTTTLYMLTPLHHLGYQYTQEIRIRFPIIYWAFFIMALVVFIRIDRAEDAQKELVRKADESNRLKSEFLANMSHEIRTPMNAIMGMCELNMSEEMCDAVRDNNESIYHSGKTLMNIINDLLDFSKISSGRMELSCGEYKISDVLNEVINMTVARMGGKQLEFAIDCDPDIPNHLYGDDMRIKQIMINLLTNALKYTQKGGFLLSLGYRKEEHGINLIISVRDSGIGIKKENIPKIFDAYGRVDAEKTHKIEGTGLGLPIAKQLIRLMNGLISVKSEYGTGTEFKVVVPQKVVDYAPFVKFEKRPDLRILYCHDLGDVPDFVAQGMLNTFAMSINKLGTQPVICSDVPEIKREMGTGLYNYIIIGQKEYFIDKDYFDKLAESISVAVIRDRGLQMTFGENIISVYKPFSARKFSELLSKQPRKWITEAPHITTEDLSVNTAATTPDVAKADNTEEISEKPTVLIVDDNEINLKVAAGFMKKFGVNAETVTSGAMAIKKITDKKYDIVFMDHLMPDMDGIQTHRRIRRISRDYARKLPVIALTANAANDVRGLFEREGFQDFMTKPIQSGVLREILVKWLPAEHRDKVKERML